MEQKGKRKAVEVNKEIREEYSDADIHRMAIELVKTMKDKEVIKEEAKAAAEWASRYKKPKKSKNIPSCSLAEALEKQDLLINSALANSGMQLLWKLFREGRTPYKGVIINLETLTSNPIKI